MKGRVVLVMGEQLNHATLQSLGRILGQGVEIEVIVDSEGRAPIIVPDVEPPSREDMIIARHVERESGLRGHAGVVIIDDDAFWDHEVVARDTLPQSLTRAVLAMGPPSLDDFRIYEDDLMAPAIDKAPMPLKVPRRQDWKQREFRRARRR